MYEQLFFTSTITNQEGLFSITNAGEQSQKHWYSVLRKCLWSCSNKQSATFNWTVPVLGNYSTSLSFHHWWGISIHKEQHSISQVNNMNRIQVLRETKLNDCISWIIVSKLTFSVPSGLSDTGTLPHNAVHNLPPPFQV